VSSGGGARRRDRPTGGATSARGDVRRRVRGAAAVATLAIALLAPTAAAHAEGAATFTLSAPAATTLKARGVTLAARAPATARGRTVTLPLVAAAAGAAVLQLRGALRLRAGRRSVTLGAPQLVLGSRSRMSALLGGQRTTVWTLAQAPTAERAAQATLAPTAAQTIARRLGVRALPRAAFATLTAAAAPAPATALACRTTTAGGPASDPGSGEPPVKPAPAAALAVTGATFTWHVRESFIGYIASGEGTRTAGGATGEPPTVEGGSEAPLVYGFHFPAAGGWCDPQTGAARLTFTGTVGFGHRDHGIDLRVNDPEVELDGPASRVVFRMTGSGDTDGGNRRAVVETLDVSRAAAVRVDGKTFSYERIPAAIPPGAADSVFAGYYLPGDPFGWVSIAFTTA
jgi:hypothetical protein